jgi:uncharacterized protein (TIGR00297 family)
MSRYSEDVRQIVHITMGGWAVLLRWMTWPEAAALATGALLFNWLVLPRIGGRSLYREADRARGYPMGILLYPFVVLLLIVLFRDRLDLVAAVWGVLAAGDGSATLIGRRVRSPRVPWNVEKSVAGTVSFIVCGTLAGALLGWWVAGRFDPQPAFVYWLGASFAAAVTAALAETIPVRLDDNISVAASAAIILACADISGMEAWRASAPATLPRFPIGLLLNGIVATAGWMAGTVTRSGVIAGLVIGASIYAGAGTGAWILLLLAFAAASASSRIGYRRKLQLGIAEERGGRRGAANAVANTGLAALGALLAVVSPYRAEALLAVAAVLIAGSSDTVASEIGKAFGRRTFLVIGFRPVPPGTSGALSLEGTTAGVAAAALLGLVAVWAGLFPRSLLLIVVIAVTAASLVESALGATLEGPRVLNNDLLNFVNTAAAAAIALLLASRL